MCEICHKIDCDIMCPNHCSKLLGTCRYCGNNIYDTDEWWADCDREIYCSEECAKEQYDIHRVDVYD